MRTIFQPVLGVLLIGVLAGSGICAHIVTVRDQGDPNRIVVCGARTFTPRAVWSGLAGNLDLRSAARSAIPLQDYLRLLEDKARAGYQRAGFPRVQVRVKVNPSDDKIEVSIEEGPRYLAGDIVIEGVDDSIKKALVEALTSACPPPNARPKIVDVDEGRPIERWIDADGDCVDPNPPLWQPGEPASFCPCDLEAMRQQVRRSLANLGYYGVSYDLKVATQSDGKTASLSLRFPSLGPKARIGEVQIIGNSRNSEQQIRDYAGVRPGMAINGRVMQSIHGKLWESGRFVDFKSRGRSDTDDPSLTRLWIEVTEYQGAPGLGDPLSPEEEVLLKLRRWLSRSEHWSGDLVFQTRQLPKPIEVVISPKRGVLIRLGKRSAELGGTSWDFAAVMTSDRLGLYDLVARRCAVGTPQNEYIRLQLSMRLTGDAKCPFAYNASWRFATRRPSGAEPFCLVLNLEPSAFLAIPHEHEAKCAWQDNMLVVEEAMICWEIERETGELKRLRIRSERGQPWSSEVTFEPKGMDRRLKEIDTTTCGQQNEWHEVWRSWSLIRFAATNQHVFELCNGKTPDPRALAVLRKLVDQAFFLPFSDRESCESKEESAEFRPPDDDGQGAETAFWLSCMDALFPRNSWPWSVGQEVIWGLLSKAGPSAEQLRHFNESDRLGPLGCLAAGYLNAALNDSPGRDFASEGLRRLDGAHFRLDYDFLLQRDSGISRILMQAAKCLRALEAEEVQLLLTLLPAADAKYVSEGASVFRHQPDGSLDDTIARAFDAMWQTGLRERIESALVDLRDCNVSPDSDLSVQPSSRDIQENSSTKVTHPNDRGYSTARKGYFLQIPDVPALLNSNEP